MNARTLRFCGALLVGLTAALAASGALAQWGYVPYGGASAYAAASGWGWGGAASAAAHAQSGYGGFYPTPYYVGHPVPYHPYYGSSCSHRAYGWYHHGRHVCRHWW
jgi:hypothetical protein